MNKYSTLILSAFAVFTGLAGIQARADNMASIAITPATGVVTLAPHWAIGGNLAGFHLMSQDWGLTGGAANEFYSIKKTVIPSGGDILAYNFYVAGSGAATPHADIGSKLTPDSYSALTSADPDVGYGSVNQYLIHHKGTTDYFTVIKPGAATASSVTDLKPMSGPGGPSTVTGVSGYFGLTFAAANLGYGLNLFYYLRTDPLTGFAKFGTLAPALAGISADQFDLGMTGYNALAFTGTDLGYGTDKMYYLRLDPITGFTIFGTLHPGTGRTGDIANLGSVFSTLTFVPGDVGFGTGRFYTTGSVNPTWQSVSFSAIADRALGAGSFTVHPTASSGLPLTLTVVTGSASISAPVAGVFTITPTQSGTITLQAAQAGQLAPTPYEFNMLRQSFTVLVSAPRTIVDFNSDGQTDILWENTVTGQRYIWYMNGVTNIGGADLGLVPLDWKMVAGADFNGDGRTDILWQNTVTGQRYIWWMNGATNTGGYDLGLVATEWKMVAAADFNGDGQADILWQNTVTGRRYIWWMNGPTNTGGYDLGLVATEWKMVAAADFNGDRQADILWQNTMTGRRYIWWMNGATNTGGYDLGLVALDWQMVSAADYNGDGQTDILWQNTVTGQRYIWRMNGAMNTGGYDLGLVALDWSIVK